MKPTNNVVQDGAAIACVFNKTELETFVSNFSKGSAYIRRPLNGSVRQSEIKEGKNIAICYSSQLQTSSKHE